LININFYRPLPSEKAGVKLTKINRWRLETLTL